MAGSCAGATCGVLRLWAWGGSGGKAFLSPTLSYEFVVRQLSGSAAQEQGGFPPGSGSGLTAKADGGGSCGAGLWFRAGGRGQRNS